jgi:alginate O-acetyltransferase complex protein AlgI
MLFTSLSFLILLAFTFVLYYVPCFETAQMLVLIIASLIFYAYQDPILLLLLLTSVTINIVTSYKIVYGAPERRRSFAIAGVALNLITLIFFKYSTLIAKTFLDENEPIGHFLASIPLPLGISFFTFQGISLVVDVYQEKYFKGRDVIPASVLRQAQIILFFKSFFPQLISGPIVKAHDFLPQIKPKKFGEIDWQSCFKMLVTGYFLKMVIADNIKDQTYWIAFPYFYQYSSGTLVTMLVGYSFQIFTDFAGYSLIALGLAKLFGYDLPQNFNFPYISTSFSEFWRRWHMSLSSFLKEYLYVPLGGNRKGTIRTYLNLILTMILGGLWHGAAWSYAVWGAVHGLALALERLLGEFIRIPDKWWSRGIKGAFVFCFVSFAWLLFKLPNFGHVIDYVNSIRVNRNLTPQTRIITYILLYSLPPILYHLFYITKNRSLGRCVASLDWFIYGTMIFLIITNSGAPIAFIYFQF